MSHAGTAKVYISCRVFADEDLCLKASWLTDHLMLPRLRSDNPSAHCLHANSVMCADVQAKCAAASHKVVAAGVLHSSEETMAHERPLTTPASPQWHV